MISKTRIGAVQKPFLPVLLFAATLGAASAQVITGFGSSEVRPLDVDTDLLYPWSGTQSATAVSVADVSTMTGGIYQDLSDSPVVLNDPLSLSLTGTALSAPSGVQDFSIQLYDASDHALTGTFQWSSFTGGATVTVDLSGDAEFDGTVTGWQLNLFGGAGETVSFTFDALEVVPEPSTLILLSIGASAGGFLLFRRRGGGIRAES